MIQSGCSFSCAVAPLQGVPASIKSVSTSLVDEFRSLAQSYASFAAEAGVHLSPFHDGSLPLFSKKSSEEQSTIVNALSVCVGICEKTKAYGNQVKDSPSLIWHALKEFGFRPPSDFFGHLTESSIVEIHSPEGLQLFRSFSFYRYCSYTIEDLYCGSWSTLYERDEEIVPLIFNLAGGVFSGQIQSTVRADVPRHVVRETNSRYRYEVELEFQWLAPLFAEGTRQAVATIVIESATLLGQAYQGSSEAKVELGSSLLHN